MKRKLQNIVYLLMAAALVTSCGEKKQTSEFPDWAWVDFQRPEGINPIISPDTTTLFYCPMRQDSIAWEASDTFNPAATIYDGKVVVLYRAEDNSQPVSEHVPLVWDMPLLTTDYISNECRTHILSGRRQPERIGKSRRLRKIRVLP